MALFEYICEKLCSWDYSIAPYKVSVSELSRDEIIDKYVDFALTLEDHTKWKHVVIKKQLAPYLMAHPKFTFSGMSAECDCAKIPMTHIHMIGYMDCSKPTIKRFFQEVYAREGLATKKGSNFYYKFIDFKHYQHLNNTVMYIGRVQLHDKGGYRAPKHHNLTPFGINCFSQLRDQKQHVRDLWTDIWKNYEKRGRSDIVDHCKEEYRKYKEQQKLLQCQKNLAKQRRYHQENGIQVSEPNSTGEGLQYRSCSCGTFGTEHHHVLCGAASHKRAEKGANKKTPTWRLAPYNRIQERARDIGIGSQPSLEILQNTADRLTANLCGTSSTNASEEKNARLDRIKRLREELLREEFELECVDNGNDRSDGSSEFTRL